MPDMSYTGPIQNIVIVGGGTSGWMCAAALSKVLSRNVHITLIESEAIGTVGVGEATIPTLRTFNEILGIDEDDFLRQTQGTIKLGIEFVDWDTVGNRYVHPFGLNGVDLEALKFHQFWLKARQHDAAEAGPLSDYNLSAVAAGMGRFTRPTGGPNTVLSSLKYAFHFDAGLYARYLRNHSEKRGVMRIEGKITDVQLRPESGFIASVATENGQHIRGDLFIDCSGFRGLLIEGALKTGYTPWTHWLPCDRAVAMLCERVEVPIPLTRSTADAAGWRWRIPLRHRTGNGYVYASDYVSEEAATERLLATLDGKSLASPNHLRFTTGRRNLFWNKNCIAVGLSGGFIEPLESTSIHLIQMGIARLMALFPDAGFAQAEIDEYNRQSINEYELVRDFIILHYKSMRRDDTPLWRYCRDMAIPDTLAAKIELFRTKGRVFKNEEDPFPTDSWLAVLLGQGHNPQGYDPLVDALNFDEVRGYLRHIKGVIAKTAAVMPTHNDFLERLSQSSLAQGDLAAK